MNFRNPRPGARLRRSAGLHSVAISRPCGPRDRTLKMASARAYPARTCSRAVNQTMTPSGVEQRSIDVLRGLGCGVNQTMTPSGVEQVGPFLLRDTGQEV